MLRIYFAIVLFYIMFINGTVSVCSEVCTQTDELNQVVEDPIQGIDRGETSLSDIDSPSKRGKKLLNTKY